MLLVGAALVIMAAAGLWYKQKGADYKQVESMETQSLIAGMKEKYTLHWVNMIRLITPDEYL